MNKNQKNIIIIESIVLVIAIIIYAIAPSSERKVDLQPLKDSLVEIRVKLDALKNTYTGKKFFELKIEELEKGLKSLEAGLEEKIDNVKALELSADIKELETEIVKASTLFEDCKSSETKFNEIKDKRFEFEKENKKELKEFEEVAKKFKIITNELLKIEKLLSNMETEEVLEYVKKELVTVQNEWSALESLLVSLKKFEKERVTRPPTTTRPPSSTRPPKDEVVETPKDDEEEKPPEPTGPTTRADIVKRVAPEYPQSIKDMGVGGKVYIKVIINPDGSVKSAAIHSSKTKNATLDNNALRAAKKCTYKPALKNGVPIEGTVMLPFEFKP